jgi:heptose-I-phosphate ethanolaminephosphotransferase
MIKPYLQLLRSRRYWSHFILWLYPFFLTVGYAFFTQRRSLTARSVTHAAVFSAGVFGSLLGALVFVESPRIKSRGLQLGYLFQALFLFLWSYHSCLYGEMIGLPSIFAILRTNPGEARGYLLENLHFKYLVLSALTSAPLLFLALKPPALPERHADTARRHLAIPLVLLAAIAYLSIAAGKTYWMLYDPAVGIPFTAAQALKESAVINGTYARMEKRPPLPGLPMPAGPITHVLVIGESLNRDHMSLYGYDRKTTPRLDGLSGELLVARDACSSRNTTIMQLPELLTFAQREDSSAFFDGPNLLQVMHAAGFETYWISNQEEAGLLDSLASIYAHFADHKIFVDHTGWADGVSLDEKVLPPFAEALASKAERKFIVVHLIGSHSEYRRRYPKAFERFPRDTELDQYDNSVVYNDEILSRLLGDLRARTPATLTYLSDHGEAFGARGFNGHAEGIRDPAINRIPLLFWVSTPAQRDVRSKLAILNSHLKAPFQSDQTIHTLLDFYGVQFPLAKPENSLFSAAFRPKDRYCDHLR